MSKNENPSPQTNVQPIVTSIDTLRNAAKDVLVKRGWEPGNTLGFQNITGLMAEFGMQVYRGEIGCGYPNCGCCADAACEDALKQHPDLGGTPPQTNMRASECQYAKDQGTPEHHCAVRCVYEDQTIGHPEARSVLWNFAINACAAMIENNIIMDTSAGKVLAPRQDGNRDGLHYATAIRGLSAAEGQKAALQPIPDDSLQAQIGGIGNQIHNLGCEHHNNEELAERLGELASSLWSLSASVADLSPQHHLEGASDAG